MSTSSSNDSPILSEPEARSLGYDPLGAVWGFLHDAQVGLVDELGDVRGWLTEAERLEIERAVTAWAASIVAEIRQVLA